MNGPPCVLCGDEATHNEDKEDGEGGISPTPICEICCSGEDSACDAAGLVPSKMWGLALPEGYVGTVKGIVLTDDGTIIVELEPGSRVTVDFDFRGAMTTPVFARTLQIRTLG